MSATSHGTTPYYYVPAESRHPVMAAIGLGFVIAGAGNWVNGHTWGMYLLFVGIAWWLFVLYQWFGDAIRESEQGLYSHRIDLSYRWSMSWFIFSEVMFFGAFFTALWWALRSIECVSCRQRGVLLFMPTCERACLACLGTNPALRMMRTRDARRRFELDNRHVRSLNVMKSIPWQYETGGSVLYQPYIRLVNEEQARQLGLRVHAARDRERARNKEVLFIAIGP